jgi:hypothetical protein
VLLSSPGCRGGKMAGTRSATRNFMAFAALH